MQAPALSPKLQDTLKAFRDGGVTPTDAELAWLVLLRWPCDNPRDGSVAWIPGAPVVFGGIRFYALHRRARSWFLRAYRLLEDNRHDQTTAYLYAHANSALGDNSLIQMMGIAEIRKTLRAWDDQLAIPDSAIAPLCDRLRQLDGEVLTTVPDPDARPKPEQATDGNQDARFAAAMCLSFPGSTPEYWLSGIAETDALAMQTAESDGEFAESEARLAAVHEYLRAVKWIWLNHAEDRQPNG